MWMRKSIFIILFVLFNYSCVAQVKTNQLQEKNEDFIKTNTEEMLSPEEAELLNSLLKNSRGKFDFEGKKIAFITGSSGGRILSKMDFFNTCINPWLENNEKPQVFMVLLNDKEKMKSAGYDVLVLSWVKVFTQKYKRKVIKQLSQN